VITCSGSSYNVSETLSTLRFGTRAKSIRNKPRVNQVRTHVCLVLMGGLVWAAHLLGPVFLTPHGI
jgi:hypothetical protein